MQLKELLLIQIIRFSLLRKLQTPTLGNLRSIQDTKIQKRLQVVYRHSVFTFRATDWRQKGTEIYRRHWLEEEDRAARCTTTITTLR